MLTELEAPYSKIISASDYIRIVSEEHIYIACADHYLVDTIKDKTVQYNQAEVVELGCGPGRILPLLANIKNIKLTGVDHDVDFIEHAKKITNHLGVNIKLADVMTYKHNQAVRAFCSMGFHHHVPKGEPTEKYLLNIFSQLESGGYYILSDEFIPNYNTESEREIALIIWYSHVIADALKHDYNYLAEEESKTLLDDIYTGRSDNSIKTQRQIQLVMSKVSAINTAAEAKRMDTAKALSQELIREINVDFTSTLNDNEILDLSRGDYKICDQVLRKEVESVGFIVESVKSIGQIAHIGAMSIYTLKKP